MHGGGWMLGSIEGHDQTCTDLAGPNWHRCGQH
ncbi:MAG: alpha/beta hydrolase fold domain-containing protein [Roseicyclus sp.]|nr:alpha/beta hydrolase fold domain-containing protein [Roseicyclus sp.]